MARQNDNNKKAKQQPKGDYPVGYAKPPEATRWKKGCESPNKKGRPPKPTAGALVRDAFTSSYQEIVGYKDGQPITAIQAGALKVRKNVLEKGSVKDLKEWLALGERYGAIDVADLQPKQQSGVLVVPMASATVEDWERDHGAAAKGKPPPEDMMRYFRSFKDESSGEPH